VKEHFSVFDIDEADVRAGLGDGHAAEQPEIEDDFIDHCPTSAVD
jgi:hypothetical protein